MGEEVHMPEYGSCDEEERVREWEVGLPSTDDLTPLSQPLIPPELASAFNIKPETFRTALDVDRASQNTLATLRGSGGHSSPTAAATAAAFPHNGFKSFHEAPATTTDNNGALMLEDNDNDDDDERSDSRKMRRTGGGDATIEEADSLLNSNSGADDSARTLKRPRLVWTPQLHKRFVDVVSHLGIKNAVPKTIMQLMNVEGLTRENVASHLQKYRLYLKRMQGLSNEGPSSSDQLFASTPVPQSLQENGGGPGGSSSNGHAHHHGNNGQVGMPVPLPPYGAPSMMPMPVFGMGHHHGQISGMPPHHGMGSYSGMEPHHHRAYGLMQQRDWSGNYNGSVVSYPHLSAGEK